MTDLQWLIWWMQDAVVWEWIRTASAALAGAFLGGFFTMRAQRNANEAQAERDDVARDRQIADARRASVEADMRKLHGRFVALMSAIDASRNSIGHMIGEDPWRDEWKRIWDYETRTTLRVDADLIPLPIVREHVLLVISYLNDAADHSWEAHWCGAPNRSLRRLTGLLAAEGAETLAIYLRHDEHSSRRSDFFAALKSEAEEYSAWEQLQIDSSERNAEEWYESLSEEERAQLEADYPRLRAAQDRLLRRSEGEMPASGEQA